MSQPAGWLSENLERQFPFAESLYSGTSPVPKDLLADLRLFLSGSTEINVFLSRFDYDLTADAYTLEFSSAADNSVVLSGTVPRLDAGASRVFKKQIIYDGPKVCLFTPGPRWQDPSWGYNDPETPISWTKSWVSQDAKLDASVVINGPKTFQRIFIADQSIPPENEWPVNRGQTLKAGYNMQFDINGSEDRIPIAPLLFGRNSQTLDEVVAVAAIPVAGAGYPPSNPEKFKPIDYVARINGIGPDEAGNLVVELQDCLRIEVPVDDDQEIIPNTLQLFSDCIPCCDCGEYQKVSNAIGRRSAKVSDLCDYLKKIADDFETAYNDGLEVLKRRRQPIVRVRNLRAHESCLIFTVQNACAVPLYAYVALRFLNGIPEPPLEVYRDQPNVVTIAQTEANAIPLIEAHRYTLPDMPASPYENASAGVPEEFEALVQYCYCVGVQTTSSPFSPIPPGSSVDVAITSPSIAAKIADLVAQNKSNATIDQISIGAYYPRIQFSSVGVYGYLKSFPCKAESVGMEIVKNKSPEIVYSSCGRGTEFVSQRIS